ncbi:hypothetical protein V5O48_007758 [Marasmius crinis-equi]|uniref:Non-haem dioxygenase N-terminal domain-containing protein n=1 Tax=Marasmius crinis-equi TaxID=585013 RepID=A0ABR3FFX7_9AGAR
MLASFTVSTARPVRSGVVRHSSGLIVVNNHGIPKHVIAAAVQAGKTFWALPESLKADLDIHKSPNFKGYTALLGENTDPNGKGDLHEGFDIGWEELGGGNRQDSSSRDDGAMTGSNVWPELPGFRETVLAYYHAAIQLGRSLFPLFALALNLPENFFDDKTTKPAAIMRLLHYPPQSPTKVDVDGEVIGIGAHTESTLHRVINKSGKERHSIPVFFGTNYDVPLEPIPSCISEDSPPKYEVVTAGEYVKSRLEATYAHSSLTD